MTIPFQITLKENKTLISRHHRSFPTFEILKLSISFLLLLYPMQQVICRNRNHNFFQWHEFLAMTIHDFATNIEVRNYMAKLFSSLVLLCFVVCTMAMYLRMPLSYIYAEFWNVYIIKISLELLVVWEMSFNKRRILILSVEAWLQFPHIVRF